MPSTQQPKVFDLLASVISVKLKACDDGDLQLLIPEADTTSAATDHCSLKVLVRGPSLFIPELVSLLDEIFILRRQFAGFLHCDQCLVCLV